MAKKFNYKTIYSQLKKEIEEGNPDEGKLLPTEMCTAEKFQVSRPTVSKVYNQLEKDGLVKRRKGMGTIVTYQKKEDRKLTFGLLLPGAGESEIFSIINDQILRKANSEQFNCLWEGATANNAHIRKNLIENSCSDYIENKVDGIFFSPLERVRDANQLNLQICEKIHNAGIPLVLIDRDIVPIPNKSIYDVVGLDNYNAGIIMAIHMIKTGCQNIYFFYRPYSAYSVKIRQQAVRDTVLEAGLDFCKQNIFCADPEDMHEVRQIPIIRGNTGIICANDATAAVLMSSLDSIGYKCGKDYLLSGYDDMKYSQYLRCPLTSFIQPCKEIANVGIDLMMRRIKKPDSAPISAYLNGTIIERESTKFIK
jgi:GntR family transcriptional regulator of arabinose operon